MTKEELDAIKKTFPWTYQSYGTTQGWMMRVLDRNGKEVDLLTILKFVCYISQRLNQK